MKKRRTKKIDWKLSEEERCDVAEFFMDFGTEYSAEVRPSEAAVEKLVERVMDEGIGFATFHEGVCVGAIAGIIHPNLWNEKLMMVSEVCWRIAPEFRKSTLGGKLLLKYLEEAEKLKLSVVMTTLDTTPSSIGEGLKRRGFTQKERSWVIFRP